MDDQKSADATEESQEMSPYFDSPQDAVARYAHCPICGSNLHFSHVTDFIRNLTLESARCPECGLKGRKITHKLQ